MKMTSDDGPLDNMTPVSSEADFDQFINQAKQILANNWTGIFTKPTAELYPYQWSWDSAFIAMGYAHYNPEKAMRELQHLMDAQWKNGMIPQIVFSDTSKTDSYFPGPDFWQIEKSENAPDHIQTSGICQPPVHATALLHILKHAPDSYHPDIKSAAEKLFTHLHKWHEFLYRERDPHNEGLVSIRHPWGSGQDNSPIWDSVLSDIDLSNKHIPDYERKDILLIHSDERPTNDDYDKYVYLVDFFRQRNYDEKKIYQDGCPFMIQDVLFNTLLCQANRDLAEIARYLGKDPKLYESRADQTANAMNEKLWDEQHHMYIDVDMNSGKQIHAHVLSGFIPLFAGIPDQNRAKKMFDYLNTHSFCQLEDACLAAPSYDKSGPGYSTKKYWRGPIWINMNWLLAEGLDKYGFHDYSVKIRDSIIQLIRMNGFCEYFNPDNGEGHGADNFSWSASLFIDIVSRYREETEFRSQN